MTIFLITLLCSIFCGLLHCLVTYFFIKTKARAPIYTIISHAKLIMLIWFIVTPLFLFLILNNGFFLIDFIEKNKTFFYYLTGIVFLFFFFFVYISIYYIIDRSVSSSIMIAIEKSKNKGMSLSEIKDFYGIDQKYDMELKGMVEGGFIRVCEGRYKNTFKGFLFSCYALFFKRIYKIGLGGY